MLPGYLLPTYRVWPSLTSFHRPRHVGATGPGLLGLGFAYRGMSLGEAQPRAGPGPPAPLSNLMWEVLGCIRIMLILKLSIAERGLELASTPGSPARGRGLPGGTRRSLEFPGMP